MPFSMTSSPPGAFLPGFPRLIPPGVDVSEGETYPPQFGFVGPAPAWADPALTWPADKPLPPTVASVYILLGPGQTPGLSPYRSAPGYIPSWQISGAEGEYIPPSGASRYLLLGPGASPGYEPSPFSVGLWPWWGVVGEEAEANLYYQGLMGIDSAIWYTDICPNCGKVHRAFAPPTVTPAGQLQMIIPCYAGVIPGPVFVLFTPAGHSVPAPSAVLNAIATGKVVSP